MGKLPARDFHVTTAGSAPGGGAPGKGRRREGGVGVFVRAIVCHEAGTICPIIRVILGSGQGWTPSCVASLSSGIGCTAPHLQHQHGEAPLKWSSSVLSALISLIGRSRQGLLAWEVAVQEQIGHLRAWKQVTPEPMASFTWSGILRGGGFASM